MSRRLAALVAAPTFVVAIGLLGVEAWRLVRPRSPLFAAPFAYSLGDAIATGNVPQAYQYIRSGQDPNEPIAVRHPDLTGGRWVLVSPLVWAVALGHVDAVKMLLGYGARLDRAPNRQAVCLADALGKDDIARVLRTVGGVPPGGTCDPLDAGGLPLLRQVSLAW